MLMYPEVQNKACNELVEVVGSVCRQARLFPTYGQNDAVMVTQPFPSVSCQCMPRGRSLPLEDARDQFGTGHL
jgi:hypothetical protein